MAATRGAKKAPAKSPKSRGVAKKPKAAKAKAATKAKAAPAAGGAADVTVFRRAATKMEGLLGAAGLSVSINPEGKPRKGTFEVKVGGKTKLSLVGMPRPFKKLRETDLDALAEEIIKAK